MSYLTDLETRRDAVSAELAALTSSAAGGKPNVLSGDGSDVDHEKYKAGLYAELEKLDALIAKANQDADADAGEVGIVESEEWV